MLTSTKRIIVAGTATETPSATAVPGTSAVSTRKKVVALAVATTRTSTQSDCRVRMSVGFRSKRSLSAMTAISATPVMTAPSPNESVGSPDVSGRASTTERGDTGPPRPRGRGRTRGARRFAASPCHRRRSWFVVYSAGGVVRCCWSPAGQRAASYASAMTSTAVRRSSSAVAYEIRAEPLPRAPNASPGTTTTPRSIHSLTNPSGTFGIA